MTITPLEQMLMLGWQRAKQYAQCIDSQNIDAPESIDSTSSLCAIVHLMNDFCELHNPSIPIIEERLSNQPFE